MKIKICGLKRPEDIEVANVLQPDYIGFVFAGTKRKISFEQAEEFAQMVRGNMQKVGVFVDEQVEHVIELLRKGVIDIAQLHGSEPEADIERIHRETAKPVIKAIKVSCREDVLAYEHSTADYLLFDNGQGTGKCFSWEVLEALKEEPMLQNRKYFVAGGIDTENITDALHRHAKAFGLDLSTGVETDGWKDPEKMKIVVERVREYTEG